MLISNPGMFFVGLIIKIAVKINNVNINNFTNRGISIHDSGSVIHPANKELVAKYIVAKWSISSQGQAKRNNMEIKKKETTSIKNTEPIQQGTQIQSEEADF